MMMMMMMMIIIIIIKRYIIIDLPQLSKIQRHTVKVKCFGTTTGLWSLCHIITQSGGQFTNISELPDVPASG
jgi:hypothetical protein